MCQESSVTKPVSRMRSRRLSVLQNLREVEILESRVLLIVFTNLMLEKRFLIGRTSFLYFNNHNSPLLVCTYSSSFVSDPQGFKKFSTLKSLYTPP